MAATMEDVDGGEKENLPFEESFSKVNVLDGLYTRRELLVGIEQGFVGSPLQNRIFFRLTDGGLVRISGRNVVLLIHQAIVRYFALDTFGSRLRNVGGVQYSMFRLPTDDNIEDDTVLNSFILGTIPFKMKPNTPKYINVSVSNVRGSLGSPEHSAILATFIYTPQAFGGTFFAETARKKDLLLASSSLSYLTVQLLDEHIQPLQLTVGQATFVKMKLTQKDNKSFDLCASSKSRLSAGTNADFTMMLQPPIALQEGCSWKVALQSVIFPTRFERWGAEDMFSAFGDPIKIAAEGHSTFGIPLTPAQLNNTDQLLQSILDGANNSPAGELIHLTTKDSGRLHVWCVQKIRLVELQFARNIALILGLIDVSDDPFHTVVLGGGRSIPDKSRSYIAPYRIDLDRLAPASMMLSTDIIAPTIVGDGYSKVLKMIPVFGSGGGDGDDSAAAEDYGSGMMDTQMYEVKQYDYVKVSHSYIQSIDFKLKTVEGLPVHFLSDQEEVLYNLKFTMKK